MIRRSIIVPVRLHLNLRKGEDGWYVVTCKEHSGIITQGKTIKHAVANGREAAQLFIECVLEECGYGKKKRNR